MTTTTSDRGQFTPVTPDVTAELRGRAMTGNVISLDQRRAQREERFIQSLDPVDRAIIACRRIAKECRVIADRVEGPRR